MQAAMGEKTKPVIVEAYVDPFEPPLPPEIESEFTKNVVKSFAKGQPHASRIGLTVFRNQINLLLKDTKTNITKVKDAM
jgi:pyruvate dehydrogenase (quinone)/pyruvate oxidase